MTRSKIKNRKFKIILTALVFAAAVQTYAFCGFYVAKAGAGLYNNKSEVILVRDGRLTTMTMSNDFKGDVKDFAMVVPVPEILRERDIKVVNRDIFDKIDAYSAPRMVEYYDENPCHPNVTYKYYRNMGASVAENMAQKRVDKEDHVTIEAQYTIGEYDIMILSAEESSGLENWLKTNGYSIPDNAREVLQPYINDKLKFFVVKVNLENKRNNGFDYLRPIQITYENDRFMLPIRLGMANSRGTQDLVVYTFTRNGRVECTNYRTEKMPTGNQIPTFVMNQFDSFYIKTFNRQYIRNNKNTVFLEYAWNVTPSFNGMKCDPCVGNPPMLTEFQEAGVTWLNGNPSAYVFFTRLHVRYSRSEFPQDLMFQVTPNTENYQARYVITHPATDVDCSEGQKYLQKLSTRKLLEVMEYCRLTGDAPQQYAWYAPQVSDIRKDQGAVRNIDADRLQAAADDGDSVTEEALLKQGSGDFSAPLGENSASDRPLLLLLIPLSLLLISALHKIKLNKKGEAKQKISG